MIRGNWFVLLGIMVAGNSNADWDGGIEAGTRLDSGQRNPALRFFARNQAEPLSHYLYLDWIRQSGGSNYRIGYNPTFNISRSVYSFGRFSIEEDDPDGIEREIDVEVGIGNNLFQRGNTRFKVEVGLGARQLTFDGIEDTTDEGFFLLAGTLSTRVLALLRFNASVDTKVGNDQTTLDGEVGVSIPIGPATSLHYIYSATRFELDGQDDLVNEDAFFTIRYGF